MFEPIEGGSYEDINTLKKGEAFIRCYLPPVPKKEDILFSDLPISEQYWKRTPLPEWWGELLLEETKAKENNPKYFNPKLQKFRNQEWLRRLNGVWFMNNGKPTYLTGACYYYINWWRADHEQNGGYPIYNDEIRKRYYFRQICWEDPKCLGYLLIGSRGFGKTTEESSSMVESITKPPRRRQAVIQSKSEDDAKKVFLNKIRPSYNDLPEFFKPVSNHGSIPDKMLSFYRDLVRGKKAKLSTFTDEDELQNTLWYSAAKEKQLSGQSISDLFNDEIGVTDPKKEADVYIRNQVNRFCVYRNHVKVGIIRATTTVEEMDKGGAQCKNVWDDSDITQRTANGFTKSGLYRYMVSDIDSSTQYQDKYGFINKEKAKEFHDNERLARKDDHLELNSYIRKYPRDETELFTKPANKCHFDAHTLTQRLKSISEDINKPYRQGNFEWENNIRYSRIVFEPCMHDSGTFEADKDTYEKFCPKCRFHININTFPSQGEQNNVEIQNIGGREFYVPKNQLKYTAGADPYQNSFVINEGKGSKAGFYIKRKYDYLIDPPDKAMYMHVTNAPSLEYLYRAGDVYEMYEDIFKACWFHGCEVLPEANKIGLQKWLEEYYPYFLIKRPKGLTQTDPTSAKVDNGLNSSQPVINAYTDAIEYDVKNNVHKYPFPRQLYQLLHFDNSNTQKFDAAVAWGFTLLGEQKRVDQVNVQIDDRFFRVYDRNGNEIN